jgi:hypothetical protein
MDTMDILKLISTILFGGVGGALITLFYNRHRNKLQSIQYDLEIKSVFQPKKIANVSETFLTLSNSFEYQSESFKFNNLYLIDLKFYNKTIKDFGKFSFGVSLKNNDRIVNLSTVSSDRHHEISIHPNIDFNATSQIVDIDFQPFNRKDIYSISLFVTTEKGILESDSIEISTKEAIFLNKTEKKLEQYEKIKVIAANIIGFTYGCLITILVYSFFEKQQLNRDLENLQRNIEYQKQNSELSKQLIKQNDSMRILLLEDIEHFKQIDSVNKVKYNK